MLLFSFYKVLLQNSFNVYYGWFKFTIMQAFQISFDLKAKWLKFIENTIHPIFIAPQTNVHFKWIFANGLWTNESLISI
jgi:hypothetical protein